MRKTFFFCLGLLLFFGLGLLIFLWIRSFIFSTKKLYFFFSLPFIIGFRLMVFQLNFRSGFSYSENYIIHISLYIYYLYAHKDIIIYIIIFRLHAPFETIISTHNILIFTQNILSKK